MNYKTILMASAAVVFAGSAMAADLTNPFYAPTEGKFSSDTTLEHSRLKFKHHLGVVKDTALAEEVAYGVNDNLAVHAKITNNFDVSGDYNNDHNFTYNVGAGYNMRSGDLLAQVAADYTTLNPKSYYGHKRAKEMGLKRWEKALGAKVKLGYDAGEGLTPYAMYEIEGEIDKADRDLYQSLTFGVHKYAEDWSVDAGIRYDFTTDGKNKNEWYAQAEADYYVVENVALGVYGSYYLAGNGSGNVDYDDTTGARLKVEF